MKPKPHFQFISLWGCFRNGFPVFVDYSQTQSIDQSHNNLLTHWMVYKNAKKLLKPFFTDCTSRWICFWPFRFFLTGRGHAKEMPVCF